LYFGEKDKVYDVITIGAGPSGAYASYLLAKDGLKVLLLDKGQPGDKLCTGIISEETFQNFSLSRRSILREVSSVEFVAPSGESFVYKHSSPFAHVVDRTAFDFMLMDMAQEAGVTVHRGTMVTSLEVAKDGVKVQYGGNSEFKALAQAVVLATGLNRRILRMVGLKPPNSINGMQLEINDFHDEDQIKVFLGNKIAPGSFAWLVPLRNNGVARIGVSAAGPIKPHFRRFLRLLGIEEGNVSIRSGPIPYGMATKTYADRTLVVGDAAGQAKTTTGGGIYYGLIGASIAAQVLKEALSKGDLSEEFLSVYEEGWKEGLALEIEMGLRQREFFSTFNDERIDSLINFARNDGIAALIRFQAKFDWHRTFFSSFLGRPDIKRLLSIDP
jgi:geranylgeranyl reductase family protein